MVTENEFCDLVYTIIQDHPDWLTGTQRAITDGLKEALNQESVARVKAEAAVVMVWEAAKSRLKGPNRLSVMNAIINSLAFNGTILAEELKKELEGESK